MVIKFFFPILRCCFRIRSPLLILAIMVADRRTAGWRESVFRRRRASIFRRLPPSPLLSLPVLRSGSLQMRTFRWSFPHLSGSSYSFFSSSSRFSSRSAFSGLSRSYNTLRPPSRRPPLPYGSGICTRSSHAQPARSHCGPLWDIPVPVVFRTNSDSGKSRLSI